MEGLKLGGTSVQLGTSSTTVDLRVTETNSSAPTMMIDAGTYTVNWHPTYEKKSGPVVTPQAFTLNEANCPVPAQGSVIIPDVEAKNFNVGAGLQGVGSVVQALTPAEGPAGWAVAAAIASGLAGFFDTQIEAAPAQTGLSWDNSPLNWLKTKTDSVDRLRVSNPAWLDDANGFLNFDVVLTKVRRYNHYTWRCDEYQDNGFVGPDRILYANKNFIDEWKPIYTLKPGTPTGPPGTGGNA